MNYQATATIVAIFNHEKVFQQLQEIFSRKKKSLSEAVKKLSMGIRWPSIWNMRKNILIREFPDSSQLTKQMKKFTDSQQLMPIWYQSIQETTITVLRIIMSI